MTFLSRSSWLVCGALVLTGCASPLAQRAPVAASIRDELDAALSTPQLPPKLTVGKGNASVADALLPPLLPSVPKVQARQLEPRFDLAVTRAPLGTVLMSIVSGSRYNMLVHPKLADQAVTLNLRDVTVFEALDTLRDQYELDWRQEGNRLFVGPVQIQTKMFRVNYVVGRRTGSSDLRVTSSSITSTGGAGASGSAGSQGSGTSGSVSGTGSNSIPAGSGSQASSTLDSSKVNMQSDADFWRELQTTLQSLLGDKGARSISLSPQTGLVVVTALPSELRMVERYLREMQLSVNRQVVLEAKILEVQLNETYQSGINWGGLGQIGTSGNYLGLGASPALGSGGSSGGYSYTPAGASATSSVVGSLVGANGSAAISSSVGSSIPTLANLGNGGFAMALARTNFSALIQMLEGQGKVNVLSSPRIATLNNQKAVLKVGTDDFYVTNISVTQTTGTTTTNTPSVTLRPFFSGIALDVTPQIDENDAVILHVHPSVSVVSEKVKTINAGLGSPLVLPLASSNISETDSVIRAQDGQMVVIGGLMSQAYSDQNNRLPGADGALAQTLLGTVNRTSSKRELVILMKASVINSNEDWSRDILASRDRTDRIAPLVEARDK
ncbi:secretin N-terminal domain-containing protein [Curvibacter sp. HBC61]|uniref:Secretin N-terminal domain-containing protein n=1 Tax=Curvibacter cyanobacteriorum TaxID=3026422 RepID=A0ABT5N356_9BURK|nr:secretin N-terminal domain-containing protein [Curvibacter sp. HBC61]MDD0840750.1 secretin N-terminal domain-containing protein [Curvibacter sp. HBC61]